MLRRIIMREKIFIVAVVVRDYREVDMRSVAAVAVAAVAVAADMVRYWDTLA